MNIEVSAREAKDGELAKNITDVSAEVAMKLINEVGDEKRVPDLGSRETLYRWFVEDGRDAIHSAIKQRLITLRFLRKEEDFEPLKQDLERAKRLVYPTAPAVAAEEGEKVDYAEAGAESFG